MTPKVRDVMRAVALALPLALVSLGAVSADPTLRGAVNTLRSDHGRSGLAWSPALAAIAEAHAKDLARRGVLSHGNAAGEGPGPRARQAGYAWCWIAENVAQGQPDLAAVLAAWMASPGHRRNMLDREVSEFGLARGPGRVWVTVLGRPGCG